MSTNEHKSSLKSQRHSPLTGSLLRHLLLTFVAMTMVLPFVWMVLTSLKTQTESLSSGWLPQSPQWRNYADVFSVKGVQFGRWYVNSLFVTAWVTFLQVLTSAFAAYSFSRLRWPGRDKVFFLYLSTTMVPGLVLMVPNYQIMVALNLYDSFPGLILPAAFGAFGTFLLRQFMMSIPTSLDEAAEIDGASRWQIFWNVVMPLSKPGLIALTIFTFISNYHSFFWPLIMLRSSHRYPLPIGLLAFDTSQGQEQHHLMAAVTMSVAPLIVLFVILQKHLVRGIQLGAVKG